MLTHHIFNIDLKAEFVLNNQQWLIGHKTKPNPNALYFPMNGISIPGKKNLSCFYTLQFEFIWIRIGEIIKLWNDIDFSESSTSQVSSIFLKRPVFIAKFSCFYVLIVQQKMNSIETFSSEQYT